MIVGRNENENKMLTMLAKEGDYVFRPTSINGPIAVGKGAFTTELLKVACRIVARYCDRNGENDVDISYKRFRDIEEKMLKTCFLDDDELAKMRI